MNSIWHIGPIDGDTEKCRDGQIRTEWLEKGKAERKLSLLWGAQTQQQGGAENVHQADSQIETQG